LFRATRRLRRTLVSSAEHRGHSDWCWRIWASTSPGNVSSMKATCALRKARQSMRPRARVMASVPSSEGRVPSLARHPAGGKRSRLSPPPLLPRPATAGRAR
jgi:hypothetical protein